MSIISTVMFILVSSIPLAADEPKAAGPIGFSPASRAAEADAESRAISVPNPERARAWLRALTEEPHVAGTAGDQKTAVDVREKLKSWGWEAELAEYEVLLNYPRSVELEIVRPTPIKLPTREEPFAADKDSASPEAFPGFHGYGVSGNVSGQVVYANYGRPEDFEALEKQGIDVKGKIVIVRYGELFRGLKVKYAQKRGAKGILIYSDPVDDGYGRGDVYPHGPYRPASAIQRGSVQFLSLGPGDPSTPHGPSIKGAQRLTIDPRHGFPLPLDNPSATQKEEMLRWEKEAGFAREDYYATIPSLPISYASAKPILEALGGPNVPAGWQGGLPLAYHLGPGPVEVHFAVEMDYSIRTIWNVIASIKGNVEPDRWVLVGNHRDAWVYGAVDPSSGTACTLEMCRAIGEAVKTGWKPRRTIVYASWDGEEYGLVGSTEWADHHSKDLDTKATILLNVDSAVSGPEMDLDGVPSLRDFVIQAAEAVPDFRSAKTLREVWSRRKKTAWAANAPVDLDPSVWLASASSSATPTPSSQPATTNKSADSALHLNPLGSGSDYTAFLDHLGIPSLDIGFSGKYGVYHSIYDDFYWMEKFGDPEFVTHATAARLYTVITMRAAAAEVLPLKFAPYGDALHEYVDDLRRTVLRKARGVDPQATKPPIAFDGLPKLIAAVRKFHEEAIALDQATSALAAKDGVPTTKLAAANDALQRIERAFLLPSGLPGRPWFKHAIYAPGLTTGYACWPLPGVRQAILDNDPQLLKSQLPLLVERIYAAAEAIHAATETCKGSAADGRAAGGQ